MKTIYIADNMCTVYKLVLHKIQRTLNDLGYANADSPEEADLCLVGLCASFEADEDRSVEILKRVYEAGTPVYAYGCMVTVNPGRIHSEPLFPSWDVRGLLRAITGGQYSEWDWRGIPHGFRIEADYRVCDPGKKFVAVSTGCNLVCSYCPHRIGTGPLVSVPLDEIVAQVRTLNDGPTKTIVLTGTETACYGEDTGETFVSLLDAVLGTIGRNIGVHVAQFNPEGLFRDRRYTYDLLDLFADPRVKDIQIPVQTSSPRLLALMNRNYSPDAVGRFLRRIVDAGGTFLRTDLMVGFPTETKEEFADSVAYARRYFDEVAVYTFEMKKCTPIWAAGVKPLNPINLRNRKKSGMKLLRECGILVHSGGQDVETLLENDKVKALRRRSDG